MNEEHSTNPAEVTKKSFFQSLFGRFFQGELKNRDDLVEVIRDSEQNDLIDQNTREMIEGVMEIAELRVRDIMIPRSQIVFIEDQQNLNTCLNTIIESAHSRFPVIADADGGTISDKNSHEFQTFLDIWEDVIVMDSSGYCYNLELASGIADEKNISEKEEKLEIIDSVAEIVTMEKMADYFKAPLWKMLKTVVYKTDSGRYFSIILRWDLDVNELKVEKFIRKKFSEWFKQATEEDLQTLWTVRGFVTPLKNSNLKIINFADESLKSAKNYFWGANSLAKSSKNVNISDLDILEFGDFNEPIEGFTSKNIPNEKLVFKRASEVWNIFHLWNKYTKPFGITYLDENNKTVDNVEMWCYGIWVSRLMWVMAEYFMTENWIAWPENVAPYTHYIIVIWEENIEKAEKLAKELESEWKTVILDDRMWKKFWFWQKASDCELWWIPNRIVISPKTLDAWWYELTKRGQESEIIKF